MSDVIPSIFDSVERALNGSEQLVIHHVTDRSPASCGVFVQEALPLAPEYQSWLAEHYPKGLFRHQHAALESILSGRNTVVATRTSSGKSLIFSSPALSALIDDPETTALFLYPQKALAEDQQKHLQQQVEQIPKLAKLAESRASLIARYDGDTEDMARKQIRKEVSVLLSNPDMLHWILCHHEKWARFFRNLKFVALDECHIYSGAFGSNVAYLFRRLRQICSRYGSNPIFIATSATVSSPEEHLESLIGAKFVGFGPDLDGSIQGESKLWIASNHQHHLALSRHLARELVERGHVVLVFCQSRKAAEEFHRDIPENAALRKKSRVYRAGLSPVLQREIETSLRSGDVRLVACTTALELGIDISTIDAVICAGFPQTPMSLWQQAGRAGRRGKPGAVILIPSKTPIDAHHAAHAEDYLSRAVPAQKIDLENRRVLVRHYACALAEGEDDESALDKQILGASLLRVGELHRQGKLTDEALDSAAPHLLVHLRSSFDQPYVLLAAGERHGSSEIGKVDGMHLLQECPTGAIYLHGGRTYRVISVSSSERVVRLKLEHTHNSTKSFIQRNVRIRRTMKSVGWASIRTEQVAMLVTDSILTLTERNASGATIRTDTNLGSMPRFRFPTEGLHIRLSREALEGFFASHDEAPVREALCSVERLARSLFPTVGGTCEVQDVSTAASFSKDGSFSMYVFDNVHGGIDLCARAFDQIPALLANVRQHVRDCPCSSDEGCLRCVANPLEAQKTSKRVTLAVLDQLLSDLQLEPTSTRDFSHCLDAELSDEQGRVCKVCEKSNSIDARFCNGCGEKYPDEHV
jgi:DEAD/DEAH box helicase domain-containing protein